MKIILQDRYINYQLACLTFGTQTLEQRRIKLCTKFATKNLKSDNSFFTTVGTSVNTRQKSDLVQEFKCNYGRFQKSSLPFLARLINSNNRKLCSSDTRYFEPPYIDTFVTCGQWKQCLADGFDFLSKS